MQTFTAKRVDRKAALKDKMSHALIKGVGFVNFGPLPQPNNGKPPVHPSQGAPQGSLHWLNAPLSPNPVLMKWDGSHWEHPHNPMAGNRLGWTATYLGAHGWTYKEPFTQKAE